MDYFEPIECGAAVFDIAFHGKVPILATATVAGGITMHRCDETADEATHLTEFNANRLGVRTLRFNDDEALAYGTRNGAVCVCHAETFQSISNSLAHIDGVSKVHWINSHTLVSGGDDGIIKIFDLRKPSPIVKTIEDCDDQIFDIKNLDMQLAVATGDQLAIFDCRIGPTENSGSKSGSLLAMSDHLDCDLLSLEYVRGNSRIVCGTSEGPLAVFVAGDYGDLKERIAGVSKCSNAVCKIPGRDDVILTGGDDGSVYVVKMFPHAVAGVLGRQVEPEEEVMDDLIPAADLLTVHGGLAASASMADERVWIYRLSEAHRLLSACDEGQLKPAPILSHRKEQAAKFLEDL